MTDIVTPDFAVGGFQPFSVSDWPHKIAAVIFAQGCPLRCGYCHNPHLIPRGAGQLAFADVRNILDTRRNLLDGVVFSGGEPCAQRNLPQAIASIRQLGFKIGLHTAGACPAMLGKVITDVDWVGIDVKAPQDQYEQLTGTSSWGKTMRSIDLLVSHNTPFEARTTWHPDLFTIDALLDLAGNLAASGVTTYALQRLRRKAGNHDMQRWEPGPSPSTQALANLAAMFPVFTLR
ncbi:MAG: anaerobic ribonucleoside-triphosphate reductase activating protein [Betaproteobacteria bacterium]|nr:anaerobic ribonucleoside-triphosphate reductase activating protein [Betaproteobacteria bacterium]